MRPQMPIGRYPPATPVDPIKYFALGGVGGTADGGIYDIQDLSTLHQDQIGTAAAVGQPVGMIWSKAHATTRGANLTTNGDFPSATTGWTAASATLSIVSAQLRVANSGAAAGRAHQSHPTEVGATYEITVDLKTNANGAALAVGTTNSTNVLLLLTYAAGVTQNSITARFIAQTTTSFVQLRTTSTTSGHFTEWDNVTVKKVPGRHMIQPTAALRPILRQDAEGWYYLENDDGTKVIQGGLSFTVQSGTYLCCSLRRHDLGNNNAICALGKSSTGYLRISPNTNSYAAQLRSPVEGLARADGPVIAFVDGGRASLDALVGASGAFSVAKNRRLPLSATLAGFTSNTLSGLVLWGNAGGSGTSVSTGGKLGYIVFMDQDPGADRPGIRAFAANKINAD